MINAREQRAAARGNRQQVEALVAGVAEMEHEDVVDQVQAPGAAHGAVPREAAPFGYGPWNVA